MTDAEGLSEVKRFDWGRTGMESKADGQWIDHDDYAALAERLDDVNVKDRLKTKEINILTKENRELAERLKRVRPTPMALACPQCQTRHIDAGEWASRLHHVHRCALCWHEWDVEIYSVGVAETEAEQLKAVEKERDTQCALKHNLINRLEERTADLAAMTKERDEAREWLRVRTDTKYKLEDEVERLQADLQRARVEVEQLRRIKREAVGAFNDAAKESERLKAALEEIRTFSQAHHVEQESNYWAHALLVDIPAMVEAALTETPAQEDPS